MELCCEIYQSILFCQAGSKADCLDRNLPRNHLHRCYSSMGTHLCSSGILELSARGILHKVRTKKVWFFFFLQRSPINPVIMIGRSVVAMVQFDADNLRIARPSEVLGNIKV